MDDINHIVGKCNNESTTSKNDIKPAFEENYKKIMQIRRYQENYSEAIQDYINKQKNLELQKELGMSVKKLSDTESNNSMINEMEDPTPRTVAKSQTTMKNHKSVE